MKAIVEEIEKKEITYPCLMEGCTSGDIVLFVNDTHGTVVKEGRFGYNLGSHHKGFIQGNFKPFKGKVILSND